MGQIAIRGIRLKSLSISTDPKSDEGLVSCAYQLISTNDKVLAEQLVGGYQGLKVLPSSTTVKALDEFLRLYKNDINIVLGLDTE